jgi:cytochrome b
MSAQSAEFQTAWREKVWDLPVRLCHWLLVLAIPAAYVTAQIGGSWIDWHGRIGALVLALLIFRIVWGFVGTTHARFKSFAPTPSRLSAYLRGAWNGVGHNPLGALAVLAMLTALLVQVGTGLFANDDIAFQGPLTHLVNKSTSDSLTGLHHQAFNALLALIALHICAIAFYLLGKRSNLIGPMVSGYKVVAVAEHRAAPPLRLRDVAIAAAISIAFVWVIFGNRVEQPPADAAPVAAW